jgi:hypothetical protein
MGFKPLVVSHKKSALGRFFILHNGIGDVG